MARIGLIDVDGHNFPNIPLMKLSAWHKKQGDSAEWYDPLFHSIGEPFDRVYKSKVFSFTPDFQYGINAHEVINGGTGYAIRLVDGAEIYDKTLDPDLPPEIEHIYPDYSLYPQLTKDWAYGFLTRGCPRGCTFCHVSKKEQKKSYKVADLDEFWRGQKNIMLCDPNILGCPQHLELLQQVVDSKAKVEFNQGLDVRLITEKNLELIKQIPMKYIHLAYDRIQDKDIIEPKLKSFKDATGYNYKKVMVYILVNYESTLSEDLYRIYFCRDLELDPFVMIYDKAHCDPIYKKLQRWCNNDFIFWSCPTFEEFLNDTHSKKKTERSEDLSTKLFC